MMLAFDGHQVETACNGKEALARFENGKYDVVITDLTMPDMGGDELAASIKARAPNQRLVLITAYAHTLGALNPQAKNFDFVLSKPFLLENLREAIAAVSVDSAPGP
jgi:CheY-like chemotaxis protein